MKKCGDARIRIPTIQLVTISTEVLWLTKKSSDSKFALSLLIRVSITTLISDRTGQLLFLFLTCNAVVFFVGTTVSRVKDSSEMLVSTKLYGSLLNYESLHIHCYEKHKIFQMRLILRLINVSSHLYSFDWLNFHNTCRITCLGRNTAGSSVCAR
jgi:hypothetical protein